MYTLCNEEQHTPNHSGSNNNDDDKKDSDGPDNDDDGSNDNDGNRSLRFERFRCDASSLDTIECKSAAPVSFIPLPTLPYHDHPPARPGRCLGTIYPLRDPWFFFQST